MEEVCRATNETALYKCITWFIMALFWAVLWSIHLWVLSFHLWSLIFWQTNSQMVQYAALVQTGQSYTNCYKFQVVLNDGQSL